jgi:hypothetical protein
MKHISDLFERYKNRIKPPQSAVVNEFVEVVKEVLGFDIKSEQCSYVVSTKTLHLKTPSVIKSEILRQKITLLKKMKESLGVNSPEQIV